MYYIYCILYNVKVFLIYCIIVPALTKRVGHLNIKAKMLDFETRVLIGSC